MSTSRTDAISIDASQVVSLLAQGANGHHVLFETHLIRRALATNVPVHKHPNAVSELHEVMAQLMGCEDLAAQQAVIRRLPQWLQDLTVRMYFHFLDRFLKEQPLTWH